MLKKLAVNLTMVAAIGALAFGANEAYAASPAVNAQICGAYNWCAPSQGSGDENCNDCCRQGGHMDGGLCFVYDETPDQYCLCY